ncbi:porin [uncultured Sulfuricurvum sp.]|uniref:OprD family outer membrane porin n=1 Tax=uncultured Sulfuricurvum sp. TaxID=430693 RepID=UPI00260C8CD2|nr:porin [uncultured Sulfuricurvum sp.]
MKLVKMSLAAAVLLGASAFAIDNVKVSGDAKLFYTTNDQDPQDLFDKDSSAADTALRLSVTGDLTKNVSFGVTGYAVSTLGLENNLVSNTWTGAHGVQANGSPFGAQVDDQAWIGEMWIAATLGKTTAKLGRMELDTPLAFSEKWSIVPNTFDAAVLINQDIPDTTLVGAWVGKGNGVNAIGVATGGTKAINNSTAIGDNVVGAGADFNTFLNDGAYAVAIVNNSFKPLTAQAWYYNVQNVADAYWLQADINCQLVKGLTIGAQYADISTKGLLDGAGDSSAYAFKLGYAGVENLSVSGAYSKADDEGVLKIANVATNNLGTAQSKLYTEAWWNYGYVGTPDAESWNLTAEYNAKDLAKFGVYYTNVSNDTTNVDMQEVTLTATKSFGPLDATLAYISTDADDQNNGSQYNTLQAYLTLNF